MVESNLSNSNTPVVCPRCQKNDAITKVSAVVNSGTSSTRIDSDGMTTGSSVNGKFVYDGFNTSTSYVESKTNLTKMLRKPYDVEDKGIIGKIIIGVLGILMALFGLFLRGTGAEGASAVICVFPPILLGSIMFLIGLVGFFKNRKQHQDYLVKHPAFLLAQERYNRAYYCMRDDVVFDPQNNLVSTPDQFNDFLYR